MIRLFVCLWLNYLILDILQWIRITQSLFKKLLPNYKGFWEEKLKDLQFLKKLQFHNLMLTWPNVYKNPNLFLLKSLNW